MGWLTRWRLRAQHLLTRLGAEHASPRRLGVALGVGVLIGTTPFYGLHAWIGLGVATLLRLNRVATVTATAYSLPPLVPVLWFGSVQVGSLLLGGGLLPIRYDAITAIDPFEVGRAWLVGSLVVGSGLGGVVGVAGALIAARLRARAPTPGDATTDRG
jgi:uncharacterized protein (DUF2062 family)